MSSIPEWQLVLFCMALFFGTGLSIVVIFLVGTLMVGPASLVSQIEENLVNNRLTQRPLRVRDARDEN